MELKALPLPVRGTDVVAPETTLPEGHVRSAVNVVLNNTGGWKQRPDYADLITLSGAHSLWRSEAQTRVLVAADTVLYDVDLTGSVSALFSGLPPEEPVEYCDVGPDIYFTAPGILRKITPDGLVRRPGVADLLGELPWLSTTTGGLLPGRYGFAYSLSNDLGEESGLSSIAWIDLVTQAGVTLSAIQTAPNVTQMNIYATTPNGGELYLHATRSISTSASVVDATLSRKASKQYLSPLPGGSFVRFLRGRVYVAYGPWVYVSEPFDFGLHNIKSGWINLRRTCTVLQPVEGGMFCGLREKTLFLRGTGPQDFVQELASKRGAIAHTGSNVAADLVGEQGLPVAAWLSEIGMAIGHVDGSVTYPQADRIRLTGTFGRPVFSQRTGIRQAAFCVSDGALVDTADTTI